MLPVSTIDELKDAIESKLAAKATEIVEIFQREFPGASLSNAVEGYDWSGDDDVFSIYKELLAKHLSLKLPSGLETLVVIEFGLSEERLDLSKEYEETICLRYIMLNCFLHSRIFSDDANPLFIGGKERDSWDGGWDGSPPAMADAYERVASDLFKLLSGLRFSFQL